jgi:hypothetical protein
VDPIYDYRNLGGALWGMGTIQRTPPDVVTSLYANVSCDGQFGPCPAGPVIARLDMSSTTLVLDDSTIPTVTGLAGNLVSGSTLSGTADISFTASDKGPGVYSAWLVVDGKPQPRVLLDSNNGWCVNLGQTNDGTRSFTNPDPCAESVSANLTLNTNQLAAGQHSLELIVDDAAGNQTIAYNGTIATSGVNGRGPHIANGQACAGETLSLAINGKRKPPVISFGKIVTVKGVLHCGTIPIRDARVVITTLGGPSRAAIRSSVQTALDGSFSYRVPTGPDRRLEFSYTAFSDDPGPSATAIAAIMISPRIKLRITPHRTRNQHTIHWTGTISGGPYPRHGIGLVAEVQEGRRWKIFDQIIANKKGQFRYSYHFHATVEPTTYTFRVALPDTGAPGYFYTPGGSNTVAVHVDP